MPIKGSREVPFTMPEIDKIIHGPARLTILAYLYVIESADFLFLKQQTGLTKGNLSSHLITLEKAGYVDVKKEFVDKIPRTLLRLSAKGRKAFRGYCRRGGRMHVECLHAARPRPAARQFSQPVRRSAGCGTIRKNPPSGGT